MDGVEKDIKRIAPGVKTLVIQADFYKSNLDFYRGIVRKVADLDIGFLILNAG